MTDSLLARLDATAQVQCMPVPGGSTVWRSWGAGPVVLLLHGGSGSWRHWVRNIEPLSQEYRVLVPDLPGLGDSSVLEGAPGVAAITTTIGDQLRTLAGAQDVRCVGFSFGAIIAGLLAAYPGISLRTLVLAGPPALGLPRPPIPLVKWRGAQDSAVERMRHRDNLAALMFSDPTRIDDLALEIQALNAHATRLRSRDIVSNDSLLKALQGLHGVAAAAIYGEHDAIVGDGLHLRRQVLQQTVPGLQFHVIGGAGHWVAYEAAGLFNEVLARCLRTASPRPAGSY